MIDYIPEGLFAYRWVVVNDAADTLYLEQFDVVNDRKKIAILAKQE